MKRRRISGLAAQRLSVGSGLEGALRRGLFCASLLIAGAASAQGRPAPVYPSLDLSRLEFNAGAEDSLVVGSGRLLEVGRTHVSLIGQYLDRPSYTRLGDGAADLRLGHRYEGLAQISYTVESWLQVHAQLPVVMGQAGLSSGASGAFSPAAANGLGTPTVGIRLGLLRQSDGAPLSAALGLAGGIPLGSATALARDRDPRFVPSISVGRDFGGFQLGLQSHVRFRSPENFAYRGVSNSETDTVGHEFGLGFAASSSLTQTLRAELAVLADFAMSDGASTVQTFGGVRYAIGHGAELFAGGGPAFGSLTGTPTYRLLAGIAFGTGGAGAVAALPEGVLAAVAPAAPPVVAAPAAAVVPLAVSTPDRDGDGIADATDNCVDQKGPKENQGCPVETKQLVSIKQERLENLEPVHFGVQQAEIAPASTALLEQIATVLAQHPEIARIRVEGHSDNVGNAEANFGLSRARAEAVRDFLIRKGIAAERLEAAGFGDSRPIADNSTAQGRDKNRRVDFVILKATE